MATFAAGLRTPFGRYWLSGFLADFGDGIRLAAFPLLAAEQALGALAGGALAGGALAGGALAATTGIRAPMLAGAPLLAIAVIVLAWRRRRRHSQPEGQA